MSRPPRHAAADGSPAPRVRPLLYGGMLALAVGFSLLPFVLADLGFDLSPYPWNFNPILPLCLYGAAFLRNRALAVALPALGWVGQGFAVWAYTGNAAMGFPAVIVWVYASLLLAAGLGLALRTDRRPLSVAGAGLGAGAVFFLVSNFGVWAGGGYAYTLAGLIECYELALPFYRGTLLSLVVFLPALFAPAAVRRPAARPVGAPA